MALKIAKVHFASIVILLFLCSMAWEVFQDRQPPIEYRNIEVMTPTVVRGSEFEVRYSVDRKKTCAASVQRTIIDGAKIRWPIDDHAFRFSGPPGPDEYPVKITVPMIATPGPAIYRVVVQFKCSLFQQFWPIVSGPPDMAFTITDNRGT